MSIRHTIHLLAQMALAVLIACGLIWALQFSKVKTYEYNPEPNLFVHSRKVPPIDTNVLASKASIGRLYAFSTPRWGEPKELDNKALIRCLIHYESKGRVDAYNPLDTDGKPKYGILQFGIDTFKDFCVNKYGYKFKIWNPDIQKKCADKMINDGYAWRWGTYHNCEGRSKTIFGR